MNFAVLLRNKIQLYKKISKISLVFLLILGSCSTQKNTFVTRTYHSVTSKYNILFNGSESFKKGNLQISKAYNDNYNEVLPVYYYGNKSVNDASASDMDRTIKKAEKIISLHSITVKPEVKNNKPLSPRKRVFNSKKEYNWFVDENYLLMGKAYFYKHEFDKAKEIFQFILTEFKSPKVQNESRIWLARTYNETKSFENARELLKDLEEDPSLSRRHKTQLYGTVADFHIKQANYEAAIPYLEKARKTIKTKKLRVRYTFILAQLYEKTGNLKLASDMYDRVIKMNPQYEMTFHAKINRALAYEKGFSSVREIESQLYKMLKDDKNKDYQDQIYFALGNISLKEGDINEAIKRYKKSVEKNTVNTEQKTHSYITLADLYYGIPDYVNAQVYYDSAVSMLDVSYPDYDILFSKSKNLNNLVQQINTVQFEDSVQRLARLPQNELVALIDKIIEDLSKKEAEERDNEQQRMLDEQFGRELANQSTTGIITDKGGWYFYNETAKALGYKEFKLKWGNRKLEDNWRRKSKSSVSFSNEMAIEDSEFVTEEEAVKKGNVNKKSRDYYLLDIPKNDSMMQASNKRMEHALFNMGMIYKNDLKDNQKAIESFKELCTRFPASEMTLQAYYNLYSIYKTENNTALAEVYKEKIISEYPMSNYAQLLSDPNYFKKLEEEENKVINYYTDTYNHYQQGNNDIVISRCDYALANYTGDKHIPQFAFLKLLSIGKTQDVAIFRKNLYDIISKYPDTEVSESAKNFIAYLDKEKPSLKEEEEKEIALALYENVIDTPHYFIFSVPKKGSVNQLIFNIINFNLDNFDDLDLKVETADFNAENTFIVIKLFAKQSDVVPYFNQVNINERIYKDVDKKGINAFYINEKNYSVLFTDKIIDRYMKFFSAIVTQE